MSPKDKKRTRDDETQEEETPPESLESVDTVADEAGDDNRSDVEKLREERDYYLDQLQRARAELENYRRRVTRDRDRQRQRVTMDLLRQTLPLYDDLLLAVGGEANEASSDQLLDGVKLVVEKFKRLLADTRVEMIEAVGHPFDPNVHDAMFQEETDEVPAGQVLEELERGYLFEDKLLRPARVKVATEPRERAGAQGNQEQTED